MAGRGRGVAFALVALAGIGAFLAARAGVFGGQTPIPVPDGPVVGSAAPIEPRSPQDSSPTSAPQPSGMAPSNARTDTGGPPSPVPTVALGGRITIRGLDAQALADARVYVVGTAPNGRSRVAATVPAAGESFDLAAVTKGRVGGLTGLRVAVVAPGRPTGWSAVVEGGGTGASLDVEMPEGVLLEGGVVGPREEPVGGLPLVVTSAWGRTFAVFGEDLTFEGSVGRGTATRPLFLTRTVTDAAGRFALRVPPGVAVAVLADHEAWHLQVPGAGHAIGPQGQNGLVVRAWPAFTVHAEIVSASGGTAIVEPLFGLDRGRDGLNFSETFPTSEVRVTSPRQVAGDRKVSGTLRAAARGFDPRSERFLLEGGQAAVRVRMSLEPRRAEQDAAKIRIEVADASGRPVVPEGGQRPFLRIRMLEEGSAPAWVSDAALNRIDDTTLEGEVPEGEWNVQLVLPQHFVWIYATDATLTFAAGRETRWRAVLPDGGPLAIRWGATQVPAPPATVSVGICPAAKIDEAAAWVWESHPSPVPEAVFARWPEGEWIVVVGAHGAKEPRRTVTVKHGAPAVADFTK